MKKSSYLLAIFTGIALLVSSCGKNNEPSPTPAGKDIVKTIKIDASDYSSFKYFSFAKGELVQPSNAGENTDWDLGFHRYDFRTNGGLSGKGQGAAAESGSKEISEKIVIPQESKFKTDEIAKLVTKYGGMGAGHTVEYGMLPINKILTTQKKPKMVNGKPIINEVTKQPEMEVSHEGAIVSVGMPPQVHLSGKVFVIRCADGKYAKIKITEYRDEKAKTGHITMQYVYPIN
ncbi:HmuY family protein [Porphyromonas pogonae]|uniref:HmuY family protein n=1 Tax=Porphyromonas pogonae TaxID=867595 RepID=UPI002E7A2463|nr:HmuY family protein [Porphyromonas pogonae]